MYKRNTVHFVLIVLLLNSSASALTCHKALAALGTTAFFPVRAAGEFAMSVGYPLWGMPKLLYNSRAQWKESKIKVALVPIRQLREDKWHILGWVTMMTLANGTQISFTEYEDDTKEFDDGPEEGQVVLVNFSTNDDPTHELLGNLARQRHAHRDQKNVHYIEAKTTEDLMEQLEKISRTHGPIAKLDTYGHGYPGYVQVGSSPGFQSGSPIRTQLPPGVMVPGARVRIHACLTGNGEKGETLLDNLGEALLPEGGTIYAPKVLMTADVFAGVSARTGMPLPPLVVRENTDFVMRPIYGLVGGYFNLIKQVPEEKFPIGDRYRKTVVGKRSR